MALAFIITLDKDLPEAMAIYQKTKSGKALARESDRIDLAARGKHITQLTGLLSENPSALIEQMKAEGFDPSRMRIPPEKFFDASEGLKVVRTLITHITANLNDFKQPNPILMDLKAAEALLVEAEKSGARFHFTKMNL
jgi:hypothetical protein